MADLCAEILLFEVIDQTFTYKVPDTLKISVGMLVNVPFGKKHTTGIVNNIFDAHGKQHDFVLKTIDSTVYDTPLIGQDLLTLIPWLARYYAASYRSVLEAVIPVAIRRNVAAKLQSLYRIANSLPDQDLAALKKKLPKQFAVYEFLMSQKMPVDKTSLAQFSQSALNNLVKKGIVEKVTQSITRSVYRSSLKSRKNITLSDQQTAVAKKIISDLGKFAVYLLHGVTGSGKTEVYLSVIREVLHNGGDVIYLVPELSLTPQTVSRIRAGLDLPDEQVVVWHSGLSEGERRDAWLSMSNGHAKVVIGARSAVFAPFKNLRLIVVDEEHELTYKQSETPRYHARDVAVYRTKLCDALCILGSATPSLESLANATLYKYHMLTLPTRIDGSHLPTIELVDTRFESTKNYHKIISQRLETLIDEKLQKCEQIILFLNRRGYSSSVFCNSCDFVAKCPSCSTTMTYHKSSNTMRCHLCGYAEQFPVTCPNCGSPNIVQTGIGTEQLANIVANKFPNATIERIDSDTMTTKDGFHKVLQRFDAREIDILVGTQMITKGLDFPNVSLVGVINVDNAMNLPDFRANERVFQSLIQVAGRSGRGNIPGTVVIQTRNPQADTIQYAINNDFETFFRHEMAMRKEFLYPPYAHIVRIIFAGDNEYRTRILAEKFAKQLQSQHQTLLDVRGPSPAVIQKIKNNFRFSIICLCKSVLSAIDGIRSDINNLQCPKNIAYSIDVDPADMM